MSKIHLIGIDVQWDFCHEGEKGYDPTNPDPNPLIDIVKRPGNLAVSGAQNDSYRLAKLINVAGHKIDDISMTMDSHRTIHIAHPCFWRDDNGSMPTPFTVFETGDVCGKNPKWHPYNPGNQKWCEEYVVALEKRGRNKLCIWPPHCLIGSHGWQVYPPVFEALRNYTQKEWATINWLIKGDDPYTEWYSAVHADVEIPSNTKTMLNTAFIDVFKNSDLILMTGQALSHCLRFSFQDIFETLGDKAVRKFMLITDTTSPVNVPCFIDDAKNFVKKYTALGMQTCTVDEFLTGV